MNVLSVCFYLSANLCIYERFMCSSSSSCRCRGTKQDSQVVRGFGCLKCTKRLFYIHKMQRLTNVLLWHSTYAIVDLSLFASLHRRVSLSTLWKEIKKGSLSSIKLKDKSKDREQKRSSSPSTPLGEYERCWQRDFPELSDSGQYI